MQSVGRGGNGDASLTNRWVFPWLNSIPRIGSSGRARILVVDDNGDVRQRMAVALQQHGCAVEEAADAESAQRHLQGGRFDIVLSDYELPDETGATMLREAARAGTLGSATALIVTAHTQPDGAEEFEVIRKPINLDQLMLQIQRVLEAAGNVSAAPPAAVGGSAPRSAPSGRSRQASRTMRTPRPQRGRLVVSPGLRRRSTCRRSERDRSTRRRTQSLLNPNLFSVKDASPSVGGRRS